MAQSLLRQTLVCPSCISRSIAYAGTRRAFSSSSLLAKEPVPHFKQTSSPELDAWLARFRDSVFVPKHITEAQRKIVFKANAAEILRQEPVSVNLGNGIDEDYRLKPLDYTQLPRTKDLKQVIRLMKTDEDWSTLLPFLVGMAQSGRKIHVEDWEWITRRAGQAGYHHILVQCAKQSKRTGYRLATRPVARRFFQNFHYDAVAAGLQGEKLERIFKSAVVCSFLFNQKEHIPKGESSPSRLPDIIGVLLELSAARSIDAFEAKDFDDGVVRRYAEKLISAWNVVPLSVPGYAPAANQKVLEWLPMWNGINLALKVDTIQADPALQKALSSRKKEIEEKIDGAITQTKKITSGAQNRFGLMAAEALGYKM
ncbi:hypothetical protein KEM56_000530 [Ascosphaera pollenicola]|nr:hypothetical protein KEM56_000530 [Ascosphaera pollenicola]